MLLVLPSSHSSPVSVTPLPQHEPSGEFTHALAVSSQLSVEPNLSLNWITLPNGAFTSKLIGSRITYTVTPNYN